MHPTMGGGLRLARKRAGLTVEAAAEELHMDPVSLWRYEADRRDCPNDVLFRAARLYRSPWLLALHPVTAEYLRIAGSDFPIGPGDDTPPGGAALQAVA